MENQSAPPDDFEDLWELAEFAIREAFMLRSTLEYLRTWPDPLEKKLDKIKNWKKSVGLQLGNPQLIEATSALQKARGATPEVRRAAIRLALAAAHRLYFEGSE